jgi:hypothetical protein
MPGGRALASSLSELVARGPARLGGLAATVAEAISNCSASKWSKTESSQPPPVFCRRDASRRSSHPAARQARPRSTNCVGPSNAPKLLRPDPSTNLASRGWKPARRRSKAPPGRPTEMFRACTGKGYVRRKVFGRMPTSRGEASECHRDGVRRWRRRRKTIRCARAASCVAGAGGCRGSGARRGCESRLLGVAPRAMSKMSRTAGEGCL